MRAHLLLIPLFLAACVAPAENSPEWVAKSYSDALLQSRTDEMRRLLAQGIYVPDAPRDADMAALHIIRVCDQGHSASGDRRFVVVLFGGQLEGSVQGFDIKLLQENGYWKIQDAQLARNADGSPKIYERNCSVSPKPAAPHINWATATSIGVPTGMTGATIQQGPAGGP